VKHQVPKPFPRVARNISNNERQGPLERMCTLEEPSPIVVAHLKIKIEIVYAHYNVTNTFCL